MLRQRIAALVAMMGGLVVMALTLIPSGTAFACLPCDCPDNTSVNCFGPYQLYTDDDPEEGCSIDIWIIEEGQGKQAIEVTADDIADLPEAEEIDGYVLVDDAYNGYVSLYKLQSGEYQLNVGPDVEGKVHVIAWTGCPAEDPHESTYVLGA